MTFFITCPHCNQTIEVLQINCRIFRCGILKSNYTQINPHLSKVECDKLVNDDLIFGCGKPFELINEIGKWKPVPCEYI